MGIQNMSLSGRHIKASTRRVLVEAWIVCKDICPMLMSRFEHTIRGWATERSRLLTKKKYGRYPFTDKGILKWLGKAVPIPLGPFMALNYVDALRVLRGCRFSKRPFMPMVTFPKAFRGEFPSHKFP